MAYLSVRTKVMPPLLAKMTLKVSFWVLLLKQNAEVWGLLTPNTHYLA
jgi:hypothetical protein